MTIIKAYGVNWNPDFIRWAKSPTVKAPADLKGTARNPKKRAKPVELDVAEFSCVYCLYRRRDLVYVGVTDFLARRMHEHYFGSKSEQWDSFSWFGLNNINWTHRRAGILPVPRSKDGLIKLLEAFALHVSDPLLNRKMEPIVGAVKFKQVVTWTPVTESDKLRLIYRQGRI